MDAPRVRIVHADLAEAAIGLRLPFRYGPVTMHAFTEARLTVRVRDGSGREASGHAAETMAPRWFDKTPGLTPEDDVAHLRRAVALAAGAYAAAGPATAYDLHAVCDDDHRAACAAECLSPLIAQFATALVDKAVLSSLRALTGLSRIDAFHANVMGLHVGRDPDLTGIDLDRFLAGLSMTRRIEIRHTVGGVDPLREAEVAERPDDGLPVSLEEVIRWYGVRAFKLKLSAEPGHDAERLARVAEVILPAVPDARVTLDGNEAFADVEALTDAWARLRSEQAIGPLLARVAYLEQPIDRATAKDGPLGGAVPDVPVIIDESDDHPGAFAAARRLGYAGVSAKSCKGTYRALLNGARVATSGGTAFLTAEDLCTQPGPALEDDLALAALLGLPDVERNGHHYGNGRSWDGEPGSPFAPDLSANIYTTRGSALHLAIADGGVRSLELLRRS